MLGPDEVPFANCKIGPGAPPIGTAQGWLSGLHEVNKAALDPLNGWEPSLRTKTYGIGLILSDLAETGASSGWRRSLC